MDQPQKKPSTDKPCLECGDPAGIGAYCIIDFVLIMKECGFSNNIIRSLYKLARDKKVSIEEVVP